jgi:hypothetical protein
MARKTITPAQESISRALEMLGKGHKDVKDLRRVLENNVVQLPLWRDDKRGVPNELVRSALFTVRNRRAKRRHYEDEPIVMIGDGRITYRGIELRQDDEDVWLQILHLARLQPLGECVQFSAYSMLKTLGWAPTGPNYTRLRECLSRMQATALGVYSKRLQEGVSVSLIRKFEWQDANGSSLDRWQVWIEPEMKTLFGGVYYSQLEWEQRKRLGPLSKYLHGLYASHERPFPLKVETLHKGSGSDTKLLKHFKEKLIEALNQLVAIGFLADWKIDIADLVHVTRATTKNQESIK